VSTRTSARVLRQDDGAVTLEDSGRVPDGAWRFYERLGFQALDEERLALLL